jgi:hypothetical protein
MGSSGNNGIPMKTCAKANLLGALQPREQMLFPLWRSLSMTDRAVQTARTRRFVGV